MKFFFFIFACVCFLCVGVAFASEHKSVAEWEFCNRVITIKKGQIEKRIHERITINNKRGEESVGTSFYESLFQELKSVEITIRDGNGRIIERLQKKDLLKACGLGSQSSLYSDICQYLFTGGTYDYPYSVEYKSVQIVRNLFFLRGESFPYNVPIRQLSCSLIILAEMPLRYKSYGLPVQVNEASIGNNRVIVWTGQDIPKVDIDTLDPLAAHHVGLIAMVIDSFEFIAVPYSGGRWKDIGSWYARVLCDRNGWKSLTPDTVRPASREVVQNIIDSIVGEYRYVSIPMGVGGWQPRLISDVKRTKFGDCKDLTMLFIDALRQHNIASYPVLLLTRNEGIIDTTFPSFFFNHVITAVNIDDTLVWIDPTCRSCSYELLPWQDQGIYTLVVTDTGGVLTRSPVSTTEQNSIKRIYTLTIESGLTISVAIEQQFLGQDALRLRDRLMHTPYNEQKEYFQEELSACSPNYSLQSFQIMNLEDVYKPLVIQLEAVSHKAITIVRNTAYLDPRILATNWGVTVEDLTYRFPIFTGYSRQVVDSIYISFASSIRLDSIAFPKSDTVVSAAAKWTLQVLSDNEVTQKSAVLMMTYELLTNEISTEYFDRVRTLLVEADNAGNRMIKIYGIQ